MIAPMSRPLFRAFVVWMVLLVAAVINGIVREAVLAPFWGPTVAHWVSTLLLSAGIFFATLLLSPWLDLRSRREAWWVGALWFALTVGFEFIAGHFVFGTPWPTLLADYNLAQGRIWILIPVVTLLTPPVLFAMHGAAPVRRDDAIAKNWAKKDK